MPITFRRVEWETRSLEDFIMESNDNYLAREGKELNDEQIEWLQIIYEEYADSSGDIDWKKEKGDTAWYYYMSEVLGFDDETIDRYTED